MRTIRKDIRGIEPETIEVIEKYATQQGVTSNDLLRDVINDFAKRIQEVESSKILHAQIDDLIEANNRLIKTQNDNTFAMGEIVKTILERLDYYLPYIDTNEIQKARPKEKNEPFRLDFDNEDFD
ncbi:hypothetical protein [Leuconostoc mesenteroides]|uniref:hypothetical protein n=1 Tax=Leuconostoc mesenteroides TaxID=1245 RepID=UPI000B9D77DC|nr:hypothetical protein [Leuconostoc mesenteroides]BAX72900.1 hypothetical protein LEMES_01457 [Leuconostoc mesenteroides]